MALLSAGLLAGCTSVHTGNSQASAAVNQMDSFGLPAETDINPDAGRGNLLFVTLRLESGEELLFAVDTGAPSTFFDKSLTSKLGRRLGRATLLHWNDKFKSDIYAAPKLYLGNTRLMTDDHVFIWDFKQLAGQTCRPIVGILGLDCLRHYCIQLDFEAGKIRFLYPDQVNVTNPSNAYPLTYRQGLPYIHQGNLIGGADTNLMIDSGYRNDGASETGFLKRESQGERSRGDDSAANGQNPGRVWFSQCDWNGGTYTNLLIGDGKNILGLRFLARHLVTFDFPNQTMYLTQTRVGPLVDDEMQAATFFLNELKEKGQLPGWSQNDVGMIYLEPYPNFEAFDGRKHDDSSSYHYQVARSSKASPWKLQKAWRTDKDGHTTEKYPVP